MTRDERFLFRWDDLPLISHAYPGTGGVIRQELEDFQVNEVPVYLPSGQGSHAYALVEKRGLTTRDLVVALRQAGVEEKTIGVAGLKDKQAVTRQWLSVPNRHSESLAVLEDIPGVEVLERSRHKNKLGIGHLVGNQFSIRVRGASQGAERAQAILEVLKEQGVPNYFGPQRFGRFGSNAFDGLRLIKGEQVPGGIQLKRFFISALQSQLFNALLRARIEQDLYNRVVTGDWAKKHDTGGMFLVEDGALESPRAERLEISSTLTMFGKKVGLSEAQAGVLEQEVLDSFDLRWLDFAKRKGTRRISRIVLKDLDCTATEDGYIVRFLLPKGAFATTVLRELMKTEIDAPYTPSSEA